MGRKKKADTIETWKEEHRQAIKKTQERLAKAQADTEEFRKAGVRTMLYAKDIKDFLNEKDASHKDFNRIVEQRIDKIRDVLSNKAKEYSSDDDRFHNFKRAGEMLRIEPEQALIGMFAKHMVSIMDMVRDIARGEKQPIFMWDEKIGDAINYLILLEGLVTEREHKP